MPFHRLFSGDFSSLEARFLARVAELKKADPLAPVEVLAGSNLLAVYLRRRAAETLGAVVNLRFVTFLDLARETAPGADPRPPLPALGAARLARRALAETTEADAFGPLRERASLAQALLSTHGDLREAGIPAPYRDVLPRASATPDRAALLRAVGATLDRYEALAAAFSDTESLLERAAAADGPGALPERSEPLLVYGLWDLGGTRARLLERLAETRPIEAYVPGADGDGMAREDDDPALARGTPLFARLLGVEATAAGAAGRPPLVEAVLAPSDSGEAREVVRELLRAVDAGTPLHRCAVLLRHPRTQEPALVAELRLRGLPFFRPAAAGFERSAVARAAMALARIAAEDAPRDAFDALADLLETTGALPDGLTASRLARALTRAAWFGGKAKLRERLPLLRGSEERGGDDRIGGGEGRAPGEEARGRSERNRDAARGFARRLLAACPDAGPASWETHATRLGTLFEEMLGRESKALSPALDAIAALSAVEPGTAIPFADAAALLAEALALVPVPQGRFERDGVALLSLVSARGLLFDHVLLPGLSEGAFPAPPRPDPLLLDREREALRNLTGAPLPPRAGQRHLVGEKFLFALARGAARGRFVALAPTRDENDREQLPSPFLFTLPSVRGAESAELKDPVRAAARGVRRVPLGLPVSDRVFLDADEALRTAIFARPSLARSSLAPAPLADALRRGEARRRAAFTAYEGRLGRRTTLLDLEKDVLSATLLESLAICPYRALLEKGLGLREVEEPIPPLIPDSGAFGQLAHGILLRLTRELIDHGRSFAWNASELDTRVAGLAAEAVARWKDEAGADPPPVLERRTAERLATLVGAVVAHEREQKSRPSGAEVRFGLPKSPDADPALSREEPVTVEAGARTFRLRGQIDRIDLEGDRAFVLDYKFGKPSPYQKTNRGGHLLARGERVQLPVYALAAEALGAEEVTAAYLFVPPATGEPVVVRFDADQMSDAIAGLHRTLTALAEAAERGDFLPKPAGLRAEQGNCKYCAMSAVCGGGHVVVFERKWLEDGASTPLAALKEIR